MEHPVPIVTEKSVMNYQRSFVTWLSGKSGEEASVPVLADKWKHVTPPADDSLRLHRTFSVALSEVRWNSLQRFVPPLLSAARGHVEPSRCLGDTSTGQKSEAPQGGPSEAREFWNILFLRLLRAFHHDTVYRGGSPGFSGFSNPGTT